MIGSARQSEFEERENERQLYGLWKVFEDRIFHYENRRMDRRYGIPEKWRDVDKKRMQHNSNIAAVDAAVVVVVAAVAVLVAVVLWSRVVVKLVRGMLVASQVSALAWRSEVTELMRACKRMLRDRQSDVKTCPGE